ncbi:MAG: DEAD/DEAH box helicase [Tannerellaceae bacterium]|jgi:SNF2 family DNA or RNA helicase/uncharacterized Zn finger protein|nr:DEAD/DEAH box helicase [Tannerellaceae bacterium]
MATSFGKTWWGLQWLCALNSLDYSNRLSRGKAYIRKGAVKSIRILDNRVDARIQGNRRTPYSVCIILQPYKKEEIETFMKAINSNPLLLAKLLNHELPQELMDITGHKVTDLLASSWRDMQLSCSCPEHVAPCKHVAALFYALAGEIDKDPFIIFKLRRFDILERLRRLGNQDGMTENQSIFNFANVIYPEKVMPPFTRNDAAFDTLDFSSIPELGNQILSLYPSKTLFFEGDFKALLSYYYRTRIKNFEKKQILVDTSAFGKVKNSPIQITFMLDDAPRIHYHYARENSQKIETAELCSLLYETSTKHIFNYSAQFTALFFIFHYCKRLVRQGAILPQLTETGERTYRIHWTPALINRDVRKMFDTLLEITPPDLCSFFRMSRNGRMMLRNFLPEENLKAVCSLFIDYFFKSAEPPATHLGRKTAYEHNIKIAKLFFCNIHMHFYPFSEREIPGRIQLWLNRFNISRKNFTPLLAIDESGQSFECRIMVENNELPLEPPVMLADFLDSEGLLPRHIELVRDLAMLAEYLPELSEVIRSSGKTVARFDNLSMVEILEKTLPALELFGIRTLLPRSLQRILKPQLSMKIKKQSNRAYLSLDDLLDFDWRIAFGDQMLTEEEFRALSTNAGQLIRLKDSYAMMTEDEIKRVIKSLSTNRNVEPIKLLQSALGEEYEGAGIELDEEVRAEMRRLLHEDEIELPHGLQASLRPYQKRGFNWMYKNARLGFGSVLADDMGLGKTLQVIVTLLKFKEEGRLDGHPALVITPTTLLSNWEKEMQRFAPGLTNLVYHGSGRRQKLIFEPTVDVTLTSYGIIRSETEAFRKTEWGVIVLDEAQNIKNSDTAQTKAVKLLKGKVKIAMSGTPVENRLSEYWSILDFSNTGYLGNLTFFNERFAKPIELDFDKKKLENFRKITQPFVLRREKSDKTIISDLPDKLENDQYCTLSPEQVSLYNETVEANIVSVRKAEGIERQGQVLKLLNALKQICNHPSQFLRKKDYSPALSGKAGMLFHLLDNIYEAGEKALIFTQYAEMGKILVEMINDRYGKRPLFLHGSCTRLQRDEMVAEFQGRSEVDTFVLSLKAGGTGLNLTAAANVIHYDLWWNPATETQATDRAFRIGQEQNVMVHRLITKNTLEEKIDAMIQDKKALASMTVTKGESWIGNLSDKDLKELITLGDDY